MNISPLKTNNFFQSIQRTEVWQRPIVRAARRYETWTLYTMIILGSLGSVQSYRSYTAPILEPEQMLKQSGVLVSAHRSHGRGYDSMAIRLPDGTLYKYGSLGKTSDLLQHVGEPITVWSETHYDLFGTHQSAMQIMFGDQMFVSYDSIRQNMPKAKEAEYWVMLLSGVASLLSLLILWFRNPPAHAEKSDQA